MKKFLVIMLAAVFALAAFAGCQKPDTQQSGDPRDERVPLDELDVDLHPSLTARATVAPDPMNMPDFIEQFRVGGGSDIEGSKYYIVRSLKELTELTGELSGKTERAIDDDTFVADFVVAVFITVRSGGYNFEVKFAENDGNKVRVHMVTEPPAAGASVTQAFETHCILLGFSAADYYDDLEYSILLDGAPVEYANAGVSE